MTQTTDRPARPRGARGRPRDHRHDLRLLLGPHREEARAARRRGCRGQPRHREGHRPLRRAGHRRGAAQHGARHRLRRRGRRGRTGTAARPPREPPRPPGRPRGRPQAPRPRRGRAHRARRRARDGARHPPRQQRRGCSSCSPRPVVLWARLALPPRRRRQRPPRRLDDGHPRVDRRAHRLPVVGRRRAHRSRGAAWRSMDAGCRGHRRTSGSRPPPSSRRSCSSGAGWRPGPPTAPATPCAAC